MTATGSQHCTANQSAVVSVTHIIKEVDANPLCYHHHISIIPTMEDLNSIIWLSTTATDPQYCIPNQSATMSVTHIIKVVNANPLCCHNTKERILSRPASVYSGQGNAPYLLALWIRANQALTRNQPGLYVDDVDVIQHDDNQVKARQ
jgi:hypothetical protein